MIMMRKILLKVILIIDDNFNGGLYRGDISLLE